MTALPKRKKYTPEEYLALEREAEEKSEFYEGKIIPRISGSIDRAQIIANVSRELSSMINPEKDSVLPCGLKVRSADYNFFYPDVLVLNEKPIFHDSEKDVILNPKIVVEIISNETANIDRSDKFIEYQQFESVKEIVFIRQKYAIVETYSRLDERFWNYKVVIGLKKSAEFESLKVKIKLEKIYNKVKVSQSIYERNERTPREKKINESAADG